jgi:hypothetical protein
MSEKPHPNFLTVKQLVAKYPWLTLGGVRHFLFFSKQNGLDVAIKRMGRKVLIDEDRFFKWIGEHNMRGGK